MNTQNAAENAREQASGTTTDVLARPTPQATPERNSHVRQGSRGASLWLRLAAFDDEVWGPGVPWSICVSAFDRMEALGLVERKTTQKGRSERAVITADGRAMLARLRRRASEKQAKARAEALIAPSAETQQCGRNDAGVAGPPPLATAGARQPGF